MVYGPSGFVTLWVQTQFGSAPWTLYSITGMSIVAGVSQMPLAMLYCLGSTALANPILEDAARTCGRSDEHTSELQSLMRSSYAVFGLKKNKIPQTQIDN